MKNSAFKRELDFTKDLISKAWKDFRKSAAGIALFVVYLFKTVFDTIAIVLQPFAFVAVKIYLICKKLSPEVVATIITVIFTIVTFFIINRCQASQYQPTEDTTQLEERKLLTSSLDLDVLAMSIIQVESRGNDLAVSETSSASGPMQQLLIYVDEANRIQKLNNENKIFDYSDRFNRAEAIEMFKIVQRYHNREMSFQKACTLHRGFNSKQYREAVGRVYDSIQISNGINDSYVYHN